MSQGTDEFFKYVNTPNSKRHRRGYDTSSRRCLNLAERLFQQPPPFPVHRRPKNGPRSAIQKFSHSRPSPLPNWAHSDATSEKVNASQRSVGCEANRERKPATKTGKNNIYYRSLGKDNGGGNGSRETSFSGVNH